MHQARISIVLPGDDYQRLAQLAGREMRRPRDQAAYLLIGAIRREEPTDDRRAVLTASSLGPEAAA